MNSSLHRLRCLAATLLLLTPLGAAGQTTAADPTNAELKLQLTELQQLVEKLAGSVATKQDLTGLVTSQRFDQEVQRLEGTIAAQASTLADQSAQIQNLRSEMDAVTDNLRKQIGDQEEILNQISSRAGDGMHVPALLSNMQRSSQFSDEVRQVVNSSIQDTGTLEVHNLMDVGKYFKVNGLESYIPPRSTRTFSVPVGTLTTELVGDEPRRSFTVGPPGYTQRIEITPRRTQTTVWRPVAEPDPMVPVYVDTPYYVNSPVVLW